MFLTSSVVSLSLFFFRYTLCPFSVSLFPYLVTSSCLPVSSAYCSLINVLLSCLHLQLSHTHRPIHTVTNVSASKPHHFPYKLSHLTENEEKDSNVLSLVNMCQQQDEGVDLFDSSGNEFSHSSRNIFQSYSTESLRFPSDCYCFLTRFILKVN